MKGGLNESADPLHLGAGGQEGREGKERPLQNGRGVGRLKAAGKPGDQLSCNDVGAKTQRTAGGTAHPQVGEIAAALWKDVLVCRGHVGVGAEMVLHSAVKIVG